MRADALANREKILSAARTLFIERGVDVEVRDICEAAGIGMGTLYRHFPTKDELVDEIMVDLAAQLKGIMDRFDRGENERPPLVEWLEFHERWGQLGKEAHARLAWSGERADRASENPRVRKFLPMRDQRLRQWNALQTAGGVREDIPTEFLMEAMDGLLGVYLDLRERWDREKARWWLTTIFVEGFRPRRNFVSLLEQMPKD